ncbi:unnamed protein product [Rotaria socialis]|nr:unnamed protein product [Rotaria socialis]
MNIARPKCYGINCFPSNNSCQSIEQPWIQEMEISFDSTSDLNFCSCYSSQNTLDQYANSTPINISHPLARYVTYNKNDNTLIVLGDSLIDQYFVANLTRFRGFFVTDVSLATCIDTMNVYSSFCSKYERQ